MAKSPDDNLFSSSTMTFGEHIEELRGSLFRALIGIVVGFLIGLTFATYVVEWIKSPLSKALQAYHLESAMMKLDEKYQNDPPPEMLALIEEVRLVPEPIFIDPFDLLSKLKRDYPSQFGELRFTPNEFIPDDLSSDQVVGLCQRIAQGPQNQGSAIQEIWNGLSPEQQVRIRAISTQTTVTERERLAVVQIMNDLLAQRRLHEGATFEALKGMILNKETIPSLDSLRGQLESEFDAVKSRRLNRLLLAAVFAESLRRPRVNLIELAAWKPVNVRVQTLSAHEGFMIWIKAALISGIVFASPWIFWQIWEFVAAGLYPHERRFVHLFVPFSLALFFAGAALAFFFVFEPVLDFLFSFNRRMNIDAAPRFSEWLSFVLFLPLGFGLSFQLPLVMLFLERIGIFSVSAYLSKWRIAILVIFVISMLLTPADPVSMLLMAVPLTFLYFGGVLLCRWMPHRRSPFGEGHEP